MTIKQTKKYSINHMTLKPLDTKVTSRTNLPSSIPDMHCKTRMLVLHVEQTLFRGRVERLVCQALNAESVRSFEE